MNLSVVERQLSASPKFWMMMQETNILKIEVPL